MTTAFTEFGEIQLCGGNGAPSYYWDVNIGRIPGDDVECHVVMNLAEPHTVEMTRLAVVDGGVVEGVDERTCVFEAATGANICECPINNGTRWVYRARPQGASFSTTATVWDSQSDPTSSTGSGSSSSSSATSSTGGAGSSAASSAGSSSGGG